MRGNSHARFLGGLGLATAPGYPACDMKSLDIIVSHRANLLYCQQFPTLTCVVSYCDAGCESSGNNVALSEMIGRRENREADSTLVVPNRMGARNGGMSNACELLINVVIA